MLRGATAYRTTDASEGPGSSWSLRLLGEHVATDAGRWRSLGGLYVLAAVLCGGTELAVSDPRADTAGVVILAATALAIGIGLIVAYDRLPTGPTVLWSFLGLGVVLVSVLIYLSGDATSSYTLLYVWAGVEAFFFASRWGSLAFLVLIALAYAAVASLVPADQDDPATHWVMIMGSIAATGFLAAVLRAQSLLLVGHLADVARTDALTGILNRRGFEDAIDLEIERALRTEHPVALVVGDLDHFKRLNDRYGHAGGDRALEEFAALCAAQKRRMDAVARIGGEEFALVLPHTDEHGAYLVAERLRRSVREDRRQPAGERWTVSFGVAAYPKHAATADGLLKAADQALYVAKQLGRDRTALFSAEVAATTWTPPEADPRREQLAAVLVLAETLDLRDPSTAAHSQTVGRYAELIARRLGLPDERVQRIRLGGVLHDVGKLGVPDAILFKPDRLTAEEFDEIRRHPELGARILGAANLQDLGGWVLAHHERPDGRGYPMGLAGHDVPLEARILAVADAYEAMTAHRVYQPARRADEAVAELRAHAGTQFDAEVVAALVEALEGEPASAASSPVGDRHP